MLELFKAHCSSHTKPLKGEAATTTVVQLQFEPYIDAAKFIRLFTAHRA